MSIFEAYGMRLRRRRLLARAFLKRRQLATVADRTSHLRPAPILLFSTVRNERIRLPYFLEYYRKLGVDHFFFVDNGSDDGSGEYLAAQNDVSLWSTYAGYKQSRHGMDWIMHLLRRYGTGNWCLTVDVDEFLVYPFSETRSLRALTDWLDASRARAFSSMMLDMYPRGGMQEQPYREGQNPFEIAQFFDSGNYTITRNWKYRNLWIQGGPRARMFFGETPEIAPAMNKIPLVKWEAGFAYVSSTHMMLPRGLNLVYDEGGGEKPSGCLLHAKFLNTLDEKAQEEATRRQHYANGAEYAAYRDSAEKDHDMWCNWSEKYVNWRQLEILGLMSKGNWA
ncbi:MAG: glycosyltransferase family 2 protein [Tabrizicola sp.]|uniref:glycosyltransferase family 2 protein n=1 Tax=Tabrizicola sp. TaxID=2005166 RepID=UPI0027374F25|nr:glycosyltransferase family 2 protein [Tabrizicola sp.]MDP3261568.1 glycosyltransferase family 2 protein [Tabrizicola sp.]MDP3648363.1 glycosyltransferase family 2 protein [Paracoccaceae bacterium]MDZ4068378.1 glycosyltransferase family 2 protein [Tabrizicola sp.]